MTLQLATCDAVSLSSNTTQADDVPVEAREPIAVHGIASPDEGGERRVRTRLEGKPSGHVWMYVRRDNDDKVLVPCN